MKVLALTWIRLRETVFDPDDVRETGYSDAVCGEVDPEFYARYWWYRQGVRLAARREVGKVSG